MTCALGATRHGALRWGLNAERVREDEEEIVRRTRRPVAALMGVMGGMGTLLILGAVPAAGAQISVEAGENTLQDAVAQANPGDTLVLEPGLYQVSSTVLIDKDLTIKGATKHPEDVHIVAVDADDFDFQPAVFPDVLDQGHIFFANAGARKVSFSYFTVKNAPETEISEGECEEQPPFGFGLNHTECFGDGIHADGVAEVEVEHVEASLNAGNGIYVDGAQKAKFRHILAVNNGAFGIDVDTAIDLSIRHSSFIANQISGMEASGHVKGTLRADYLANVDISDTLAKGNGEIGIEVERFRKARLKDVTCSDNREDGFDADRVGEVKVSDTAFINNLDDAIELFPVDVVAEEQPADFPGSTIEDFDDLDFSGNVGEDIHHALTEN
jgi:hypothetical protein